MRNEQIHSRYKRKKIVLAIPTISGRPENMLLQTVTSLLQHLDNADRKQCYIFILDADGSITESDHIKAFKRRFSAEIATNLLIIRKIMPADYPPLPDRVGNGYAHWMAKQNIDFSFLLQYACPLGEYILQLDDDILAAPRFLKRLLNDIGYFSYFDWIAYRACPLGTIGVVFKAADSPPIIDLLREKYKQEPVDWLQSTYIKQQCQKGRFFFETPRSLFQHVGIDSTSAIATKQYVIAPASFNQFYIHDLGVGRMGWFFRPITHLYYRSKKLWYTRLNGR